MSDTDRIEKKILLRAPKERVWRAITDAAEFGEWFGVNLEGSFKPGQPITGKLKPAGYEHLSMQITIERMDPQNYFSFRWHPYAIDSKVDYSAEPTTLIEFRLEDAEDGTTLTVAESGFDGIPAARRAEAYRMDDQGWAIQVENIKRYVQG